ncbi:MAG: DNA polymerase IV [Ruminococcus sp.]|nr:DNA polymerase IV [Ruminococcus sp.]
MRVVLHSDCNGFFASVECLHNPDIREKPVAVCGSIDLRHGIVLAKNEIAKKYNIKTGEAIWQAKNKCPHLVVTEPHYDDYIRFSQMAARIYKDYSDMIEPFGLDESWLDVTASVKTFEEGRQIAEEIRKRIKFELGITVSIGVSFNKIFAKLGSDYKKPDAVTLITPQNYKDIVYPLPARDLLGVGRATEKRLRTLGILTIGDIANTPQRILHSHLGKFGDTLYSFAKGYDSSPVKPLDYSNLPKSIGNSTTPFRDMETLQDAQIVLTVLCDSVCRRAREQGLSASVVSVNIRDKDLYIISRQTKLNRSTNISAEVLHTAVKLLKESYTWRKPIRSIGVTLSELCPDTAPAQTSLFTDEHKRERQEKLDRSLDNLKKRFGSFCVRPAALLKDKALSGFSPKEENIVHPVGYFS